MIRLSTQFDRAVSRPVVAAPKSQGCCCCCCCCIVTVVACSVITARSTYRALRALDGPPRPPPTKPVMDGWTTQPVGGTSPATPEEAVAPDAKPSAPPRDVKAWVAVGALLLPMSVCLAPGLLAGVAMLLESYAPLSTRMTGWVMTAVTVALFVSLVALLRRFARLGPLGIGLLCVPMAVAVGTALVEELWFGPPFVLSVQIFVGGLVALARRGVPVKMVVGIGVGVPIALAVELGLWLLVLASGVLR